MYMEEVVREAVGSGGGNKGQRKMNLGLQMTTGNDGKKSERSTSNDELNPKYVTFSDDSRDFKRNKLPD